MKPKKYKSPKDRRIPINVSMSLNEMEKLRRQAIAAEMNLSEYIRSRCGL